MSYVTTQADLAKIAIAKNLIKEYKGSNSERTVYLKDGTEFQIHLKNPYQDHLGVKIYVNNKYLGNMLVLKPGQSCWLERFLNENRKFLFSTYEVENTQEMRYAINNNGKVKLEFYHERQDYYNSTIFVSLNDTSLGGTCYLNQGFCATQNSVDTITTGSVSSYTTTYDGNVKCNATSAGTRSIDTADTSLSLETGRVEKGNRSKQEFDTCDVDFQNYPFKTEVITILPQSRKPVSVEETRRKYCSQCGKKVSPKDKFCSNCGAKLN